MGRGEAEEKAEDNVELKKIKKNNFLFSINHHVLLRRPRWREFPYSMDYAIAMFLWAALTGFSGYSKQNKNNIKLESKTCY